MGINVSFRLRDCTRYEQGAGCEAFYAFTVLPTGETIEISSTQVRRWCAIPGCWTPDFSEAEKSAWVNSVIDVVISYAKTNGYEIVKFHPQTGNPLYDTIVTLREGEAIISTKIPTKWCEKEGVEILEAAWTPERCIPPPLPMKWCEREVKEIPEEEWSDMRCTPIGMRFCEREGGNIPKDEWISERCEMTACEIEKRRIPIAEWTLERCGVPPLEIPWHLIGIAAAILIVVPSTIYLLKR